MNLADIRTVAEAKIGLDDTAAGAEEALIDRWANEAVRDVLRRTRVVISSTTLTPAQAQYADLPTTYLEVVGVVNADLVPLTRVDFATMLGYYRANATLSGDTSRYFALEGQRLYLYPQSTGVLTVYYVPKPTEMSSGTHDPSNSTYGGIPVQHHKALEYYVLWQAADYADDPSSQMGELYRQEYERSLMRVRKSQRRMGGTRPPRIKLGGWPLARSSRNDVYP